MNTTLTIEDRIREIAKTNPIIAVFSELSRVCDLLEQGSPYAALKVDQISTDDIACIFWDTFTGVMNTATEGELIRILYTLDRARIVYLDGKTDSYAVRYVIANAYTRLYSLYCTLLQYRILN